MWMKDGKVAHLAVFERKQPGASALRAAPHQQKWRSVVAGWQQNGNMAIDSSSQQQGQHVVITGRVMRDRPNGNMRREIFIEDKGKGLLVRILLNARAHDGVSVWMTIKGARQLLCQGAKLRVEGIVLKKDEEITLDATRIQVVSVNPRTPYLTRLLSFSLEQLCELFPTTDTEASIAPGCHKESNSPNNTLPSSFVSALAPCTEAEILSTMEYCQSEREHGRALTLWKTTTLEKLANRIQQYQNPTPAVIVAQPPHTSKATWIALGRMEERWCRPSDGDDLGEDYVYHRETHSYTSKAPQTQSKDSFNTETRTISNNGSTNTGKMIPNKNLKEEEPQPAIDETTTWTVDTDEVITQREETKEQRRQQKFSVMNTTTTPLIYADINVDPCHNLPNPYDERRQRYIDERKRPQVQCMLQLIHHLLVERTGRTTGQLSDKMQQSRLHLVDVGGGRGYLAHAVAAYLLERFPKHEIHVTVLDNNQSSLQAGQTRADVAGLTRCMSFVLLDLGNNDEVKDFLNNQHAPIDVVFGLHCCGGLAEAAVELAMQSMASCFCISTCCFRSNPEMASLTRHAEKIVVGNNDNHDLLEQHKKDVSLVSSLAVAVGGKGQHRAIRAYNAMRLVAAQAKFRQQCHAKKNQVLQTWQASFPVEHSVQNRVLMGTIEAASS